MTGLNLIIIGAIIIVIFLCGIGLTFYEFKNIEQSKTSRRKHLEEDMKVEDHK